MYICYIYTLVYIFYAVKIIVLFKNNSWIMVSHFIRKNRFSSIKNSKLQALVIILRRFIHLVLLIYAYKARWWECFHRYMYYHGRMLRNNVAATLQQRCIIFLNILRDARHVKCHRFYYKKYHKILPKAHQSTALLCPLLWMISGARYSGVPHSVHVRSVSFFAKPKSVIFKCPSLAKSKFSGFKSLYTMFLAWRYSKADTISAA